MLETAQYSMALYFYMYGSFDTCLLKHSYVVVCLQGKVILNELNDIYKLILLMF
jgi:hypothetical protein